MVKQLSNKSGWVLGITFFFFAMISFFPILENIFVYMVVAFLSFFSIIHNSGLNNYHQNLHLVLCVYAYILLCLIYKMFGVSSASIGNLFVHILFFIPILFMLINTDERYDSFSKFIFWVIAFFVSVSIADNIRLCLTNPIFMLEVSREKLDLASGTNIGGFHFYSAILFFFIICFFGLLNCKNKKVQFAFIGVIMLSAIFIFAFCMKAGIIVYSLFAIVLLYLARRERRLRLFFVKVAVPSLIVYAIVSINTDFIVEHISNLFDNPRLTQRLIVLVDADNAEAESGAATVDARENLWMLSVNTWLKDPINFVFGIGDHRVDWDGGQTAEQVGIGQHSDFFDTPARYGLIGLIIITLILARSFKYLLAFYGKEYKVQLVVIFLVFVMFGFTYGVYHPAIGFVMFVFLPMMKRVIEIKPQSRVK